MLSSIIVIITSINFITIPIVSASFALPDNSDFNIGYYNNTQCQGNTIQRSSLKSFCPDTKENDGFPKCCYDTLGKVGITEHSQFNTCYSVRFNESTLMGVKYGCKLTNYHNMTYLEVFGIIGLVSIVVFLIMIAYCMVFRCCVKKHGYNTIGV
tara:strand:- start:1042 stop:1503 length:462 start_codon:yes stop_codon:yes gene_type:complete